MSGGLITALGLARLKIHLESLAHYAGIQAALIAALVMLVVLAAGFGATALIIWLAAQFGAAAAFAVVAAGFLVVALILQIVILLRKRGRARQTSMLNAEAQSDPAAFGSVAMMAVVGYLLGRQVMRR